MFLRSTAITAWALLACGGALAEECRLDQANYREARSGATIEFRAKDPTTDAAGTVVLLELRLPNLAEVFPGDVTWNAGSNTRPDGWIRRQCTPLDTENGLDSCQLWDGNIFGLANGTADILADADKAAPQAILLNNFGRALYWSVAFEEANPTVGGFDVFTLTGCRS